MRNWVAKHNKNKGGAHKSKKDYDRKNRNKMDEDVDYLDLETQLENLQMAIHSARQLQQNCTAISLWQMYQEEIDLLNEEMEKLRNES